MFPSPILRENDCIPPIFSGKNNVCPPSVVILLFGNWSLRPKKIVYLKGGGRITSLFFFFLSKHGHSCIVLNCQVGRFFSLGQLGYGKQAKSQDFKNPAKNFHNPSHLCVGL